MKLTKGKKIALISFAAFLAFMAVCTVAAKGIYASGLPRVSTAKPYSGSLTHVIAVNGTVMQGQEYGVYVESGLRVDTVVVSSGDVFEAGQELFRIETKDLAEMIRQRRLETGKLEAEMAAAVKDADSSRQSRKREANRAREDYDRKAVLADEQILVCQQAYEAAQKALALYDQYLADSAQTEGSGDSQPPGENLPAGEVTPPPGENSPAGEATPAPGENSPAGEVTPPPGENPPAGEVTPPPEENPSSGEAASLPGENSPAGEVTPLPEENPSSGEATPLPGENQPGGETTLSPGENPPAGGATPPPGENSPAGKASSPSGGNQPCRDGEGTSPAPVGSREASGVGSEEMETMAVPGGSTGTEAEAASASNRSGEGKERRNAGGTGTEAGFLPGRIVRSAESGDREKNMSAGSVTQKSGRTGSLHELSSEGMDPEKHYNRQEKRLQLEQEVVRAAQALEDAIRQKEDTLRDAARALEDANAALDAADSAVNTLALEIAYQKESTAKLEALLEADGRVYAEAAGRVIRCSLEVGSRTQDGAGIIYAKDDGERILRVVFEEAQSRHVAVGTQFEMKATMPDGSRATGTALLDYLEKGEDGMVQGRLSFDLQGMAIGQTAELTYRMQTDSYSTCISRNCVYQEGESGYYVYIAEEREGILGTEWKVRKVSVRLLDQNDTAMAVQSAEISGETRIVSGTDRPLADGDTVRVVQ